MSHVSVNPAYRIMHRKGQHMASDISGTKQAIGLAEPDLVLLGMCAIQETQSRRD